MSTERTPLLSNAAIDKRCEALLRILKYERGYSHATASKVFRGYQDGLMEARAEYEAELSRKDAEIEALRNPMISVEELDKKLAPVFQALDWGQTSNAMSLLAEARTRLAAAATNNTKDNGNNLP